jgi:serine/threonine protein kinase
MILPPYSESKTESVKVVDFGLARLRNLASDERLTQVGALIGTPCYMSPEQCRGEDLDTRSDVYTLAGILYEMLSGTHPFIASSNAEIISKHLHEFPETFPSSLGVPLSIEEVIMKGLLKNPTERQQDADSFSRELREALGKNPSLVVQGSDIANPSELDEKGVLDYQAEIEEAFDEMGKIIAKIGEENTKIAQKAAAHSANMQALNAGTMTGTARQKQKIGLLIASDMNLCARRFEDEVPHLERCTEVIDEGVSGLERLLKRTSTDDEEKLIKSRALLEQFSITAQGGIETFQSLRDTVAALKDLSKDVSRASRRLAAAIDGIVKNLMTVQAISHKMLALTDRLLQEEPAN